ncbi:6,7-dimethyl-8-ribityllumazine synthase 2 [Halioglobus japonicus]|nr:6,7-dimethyl-8-ribityllumazine synthase 2 [Halioglobus japonicus]
MKTFSIATESIVHKPRIALILARWHHNIVDQFRDAFLAEFQVIDGREVAVFEVPGAFEIPLLAKQLATTGDYAAIVAAGLVVDGGIYRHEFVASAVIDGLMQAQLDTGVPIFTGVLTPKDFISEGQAEFFEEHFVIKGREAAQACGQTLSHYRQLSAA